MSEHSPNARYYVIENGGDTNYFNIYRRDKKSNTLIFASSLNNYSNRDAILWFCRAVWPLIKEKFPELKLDIIGYNPPDLLLKYADKDSSIRVHGFANDVREFFIRADACVIPIRDGGGTRIKVLDSFAMRIPVVAASIGTEGLNVMP